MVAAYFVLACLALAVVATAQDVPVTCEPNPAELCPDLGANKFDDRQLFELPPTITNTYTYNGRVFASLLNGDVQQFSNFQCMDSQGGNTKHWVSLPDGWEVVPSIDSDVQAVLCAANFQTHWLVLGDGKAYANKNWGGACCCGQQKYSNGIATRDNNGVTEYTTTACYLVILIQRPACSDCSLAIQDAVDQALGI